MSRVQLVNDSKSDAISVDMKKPMTPAKTEQLKAARQCAVISRRHRQKERLELKLAELRALMGTDMSSDQLARITTRLLAQEETLRVSQNRITEGIQENLQLIMNEIHRLQRSVERINRPAVTAAPPHTSTYTSNIPSHLRSFMAQ